MRYLPVKSYLSILLLLPALYACIIITGCSSNKKKEQDHKTFHLNFSSGTLESMDPAFAKDLYCMWTDHMLYNTLVETNSDLHIIPGLAKSWDISDDGLLYTFHLRTDVYFHDAPEFPQGKGRKMTAADVVYSFNRIADPATASTGAWIFNGRIDTLDPFTAINDSTFRVKLLVPFHPLIEILTMPYCSILPHEVVEKWGKDFRAHPCGTGPLQFKYWDEGNILAMERNPHYWEKDSSGKQLPYLDAVTISFVDSKATEFLLFRQGKIDFINNIDGSFKDNVLSKDGMLKKEFASKFNLTEETYLNTEYIGILVDSANPLTKGSPLLNPLVRQAINYGIDRQKICTYFKNGVTTPATKGFIPESMPGHNPDATWGYHYDPQKALELLKQAGYPNGKGMPPITITTQDVWSDIVNFIATELQELGITVQVDIMQPNIIRQQMSRSGLAAFRAQWIADYPDAETYLVFFNGQSPAPPNYTRFKNATFDRWYNESLNQPDTIRWKTYERMDSLVMSYAPVIPLYYDRMLHFTQKNVHGFSSTSMNIIELKRVQKN
ncbi:MAG: ABC transporter substrate-binding protein [Flavipsychrobacter sp.]